MKIFHQRHGTAPFQPKEVRMILEGIPAVVLPKRREHALLVTGLATGKRILDLLQMRMRERANLPAIALQLTQAYFDEMRFSYGVQPDDLMFPNLLWRDMNRELPWTLRDFVLCLKFHAHEVGLDEDFVGVGTWRQSCAVIWRAPGGFEAFARSLTVPSGFNPGEQRLGQSNGWKQLGV